MSFTSILYPENIRRVNFLNQEADFFYDLKLNYIIDEILYEKEEFNLKKYFISGPEKIEVIIYRQEVFKDIENLNMYNILKNFTNKFGEILRILKFVDRIKDNEEFKYFKEEWFLEAAYIYVNALINLFNKFKFLDFKSIGFKNFYSFLREIIENENFKEFFNKTNSLKRELADLNYCLRIDGNKVVVHKYNNESEFFNYTKKILSRFKNSGKVESYKKNVVREIGLNYVEAKISHFVAKLFKNKFNKLNEYYKNYQNFLNPILKKFYYEIQFYILYYEYILPLKDKGLKFCYPEFYEIDESLKNLNLLDTGNKDNKENIQKHKFRVNVLNGFDLALAYELLKELYIKENNLNDSVYNSLKYKSLRSNFYKKLEKKNLVNTDKNSINSNSENYNNGNYNQDKIKRINNTNKEINIEFDRLGIVTNDFYLLNNESIIIVTGPNQGGKTTFARMVGQIFYLGNIGLPVPTQKAILFNYDNIFTHFEKEEKVIDLKSRLEDDLIRINRIMKKITPQSIVIANELFSGTTLKDSIFLAKKIIDQLLKKDLFCVYVTFIDELTEISERIVSMVAEIDPDNPVKRSFKILRKKANGAAYAISIAEKYCLTYDLLIKKSFD